MKKIIFKGCGTAIITPFTKDNVKNMVSKLKNFKKES